MQDFLLTMVVVFVLFRIFGRGNSGPRSTVHFMQNNYSTNEKKTEGKVTVDFVPDKKSGKLGNKDSGDYVDYEEVR